MYLPKLCSRFSRPNNVFYLFCSPNKLIFTNKTDTFNNTFCLKSHLFRRHTHKEPAVQHNRKTYQIPTPPQDRPEPETTSALRTTPTCCLPPRPASRQSPCYPIPRLKQSFNFPVVQATNRRFASLLHCPRETKNEQNCIRRFRVRPSRRRSPNGCWTREYYGRA